MKRKGLDVEDLSRLVLVSDPRCSRDGRVAFTVTKISTEDDKYYSRIWIYDGGECYSLTSGPSDRCPEWSPDGREIAFVSKRTLKEEERGEELWILRADAGGEPRLVLKSEGGVGSPRWSPDGEHILYISSVGKSEEGAKHIERIPVWFNGRGYVYGLRRHLFVVNARSGLSYQATEGEIDVEYASWSPDGKRIALVVKEDDMRPLIRDIYVLKVKDGSSQKITRSDMYIVDVEWSPGGEALFFRGSRLERGYSTHLKVWRMPPEGGEPECLTASLGRDVTNASNCDVRGPSCARALQFDDLGNLYFQVAVGGAVHLYRLSPGGEISPVIEGELVVDGYSISGGRVYYVAMKPVEPCELYVHAEEGSKKITSFNSELLASKRLVKPEKFSFTASDGQAIEGWLLRPVDFEEGKKYPAVLEIHGGPMTTYGYGFMHEFHVLSSRGYVVIYTNPRGSTGYSEEFKDIRGRYGSRDYLDLMEAVDYVLSRYDFVDGDRIGVAGGSYGGFMTNWIVGHTDRFKAAVTQRSICNWSSFYGTTDIGYYFTTDQIAGPPWEDLDKLWEMSPLRYVKNVKTPLLILHSSEDYRCWLDQALQLFTALKVLGKEAKLVVFPGENHDLSRRGKPKNRVERLRCIVEWFDRHLKGASPGTLSPKSP